MLLLIWTGVGLAIVVIFKTDLHISFSPQFPAPLFFGFYVVCIITLFFLLRNRISIEMLAEEQHHFHTIAKLLSLLAPELGRMLVGSTLADSSCSLFTCFL